MRFERSWAERDGFFLKLRKAGTRSVNQYPLFSMPAGSAGAQPSPDPLDADSVRLLTTFQAARLAQTAHPQSVRREVSQLRAVVREAGILDEPKALCTLFSDP